MITEVLIKTQGPCPYCNGAGEIRNPIWMDFDRDCKTKDEKPWQWFSRRGYSHIPPVYIDCGSCEGSGDLDSAMTLAELAQALDAVRPAGAIVPLQDCKPRMIVPTPDNRFLRDVQDEVEKAREYGPEIATPAQCVTLVLGMARAMAHHLRPEQIHAMLRPDQPAAQLRDKYLGLRADAIRVAAACKETCRIIDGLL